MLPFPSGLNQFQDWASDVHFPISVGAQSFGCYYQLIIIASLELEIGAQGIDFSSRYGF
jgi:hypothetical protein